MGPEQYPITGAIVMLGLLFTCFAFAVVAIYSQKIPILRFITFLVLSLCLCFIAANIEFFELGPRYVAKTLALTGLAIAVGTVWRYLYKSWLAPQKTVPKSEA